MASYSPRKTDQNGRILTWQIKVSRGRDPLTKKQLTPYTMTFTRPDGWSDSKTLKELERTAAAFQAACDRDEILTKEEQREQAIQEAAKPTFRRYVEIYLVQKAATLAPVSIPNYRNLLYKAVPTFGDMLIEKITPVQIKAYITNLQLNGKSDHDGKPLAHSTIERHYVVLHSLFQNALEDEVISVHPMAAMKPPRAPKDAIPKEPVVYDEQEARRLIECLNQERPMWKALMLFMLDSGCRRGEVVGLRWDAINFESGEVAIKLNAQHATGRGTYLSTPKGRKSRVITVSPPVLTVLKAWRREQATLFLAQGIQSSGFVFTQANGAMMCPTSPGGYIRRFGKKHGFEDIHCHALRHSMASLMIAHGIDIATVSAKLGHASPAITMEVYVHASKEAEQRANKIYADVLYKDSKHA